MGVRTRRPFFKRSAEYVAVRRVKVGKGDFIEPGEPVRLKNFVMRGLYRRRRIGMKDDPWTTQALASDGYPLGYVSDAAPAPDKSIEALGVDEKPDAVDEPVEPVKAGSQWSLPGLTNQKFTSRKKAREWRDAQSESSLEEEKADGS